MLGACVPVLYSLHVDLVLGVDFIGVLDVGIFLDELGERHLAPRPPGQLQSPSQRFGGRISSKRKDGRGGNQSIGRQAGE